MTDRAASTDSSLSHRRVRPPSECGLRSVLLRKLISFRKRTRDERLVSLATPKLGTSQTRRLNWGLLRFGRSGREAPAQAELRHTAPGQSINLLTARRAREIS